MMQFIVVQTLNGLVYSMLLFILALGLALTFGLLRIVNLAHGSFFLLGAYIGITAGLLTGSYWVALICGPIGAALAGGLLERSWLRYFYPRTELDQVILTFGFALVFVDIAKMIWGKNIQTIPVPAVLSGSVDLAGVTFPTYRLGLIAVGILLFVITWLALERTRIGALIRASVSDRDMVAGLGFDIRLLFTGMFALGTGLAGLAGVLGAPITGVYPGLDFEVLITTLIVVVVGGLGSISGAFWAAILVGVTDTYGRALLPAFSSFVIFGLMATVLLVRFHGRPEEEVEQA